ncbi:carotenoid cleavage dioxygenase 1 [Actinidia rufa]|uniref:carotenoid 9,10-dioxygenase n=1 Tax=Actinidia rufa TaxID=165716 RepID=A0A7J0F0M3_9ERIC|nr:carotenoid cleavage dioxygenase 1 [Actinidia rufa]
MGLKAEQRVEGGVVVVKPKPSKGLTSKAVDWFEKLIVKLMYDSSQPHQWLSGNFAPVSHETPPCKDVPVIGHLPECLNGEFVGVGANPKFAPVAGYHCMVHGLRIKDGKVTYVSRYVKTSRLKQEEYFGRAKFVKIGDLKGLFGLLMVSMQMLRAKLKVLDVSYGNGTDVLKVLADGDLQTIGLLDYDKRLTHSFTAHPKVDPFTGEMFTFGYSHTPPYITYRVVSKDGFMHDPVPITISDPIMMHDFAITKNYAIIMDLPFYFRPKSWHRSGAIHNGDGEEKVSKGVCTMESCKVVANLPENRESALLSRKLVGNAPQSRRKLAPDLVENALPTVNRRWGLWLCEICLETDLTRLNSTPMRVDLTSKGFLFAL